MTQRVTISPDGKLNRNRAKLCGTVVEAPVFDHENEKLGIKFYKMQVSATRHSGSEDIIPCIISDAEFNMEELKEGTKVLVFGQFRSFNKKVNDEKTKLLLFIYCSDIKILTEEEFTTLNNSNNNTITLIGYLCKSPIFRQTPSGREITDLFIATNRSHKRVDYTPCVVWNGNARYASRFNVGDFVVIEGRIQSRKYDKKDAEGNVTEENTAYEVSVQNIYKAGVTIKNDKK